MEVLKLVRTYLILIDKGQMFHKLIVPAKVVCS